MEYFESSDMRNAVGKYNPGDESTMPSYGVIASRIKPNTVHECDRNNCLAVDNLGRITHVRKSLEEAIRNGVF